MKSKHKSIPQAIICTQEGKKNKTNKYTKSIRVENHIHTTDTKKEKQIKHSENFVVDFL